MEQKNIEKTIENLYTGKKLYSIYNEMGPLEFQWKNFLGKKSPSYQNLDDIQKNKWNCFAEFFNKEFEKNFIYTKKIKLFNLTSDFSEVKKL